MRSQYMQITGIPAKDSPTRWRMVRRQVLNRDGWRCRMCGRAAGRFEVDHIRPLHKAPEKAWDLENLQTLCPWPCHGEKTRAENKARHAELRPKPMRDAWQQLVLELTNNQSLKGNRKNEQITEKSATA